MLVTVGTLVAGLAVVAIAFEAPMAALAFGVAAFWLFAHSVLRAWGLLGSREIAAFRRASALRMQHLIGIFEPAHLDKVPIPPHAGEHLASLKIHQIRVRQVWTGAGI
jgi:hypothetical protein